MDLKQSSIDLKISYQHIFSTFSCVFSSLPSAVGIYLLFSHRPFLPFLHTKFSNYRPSSPFWRIPLPFSKLHSLPFTHFTCFIHFFRTRGRGKHCETVSCSRFSQFARLSSRLSPQQTARGKGGWDEREGPLVLLLHV